MITVIDSGGANLSSILFALDRLGAKSQLSADPALILKSPKLILPGVGAAPAVMRNLRDRGLLSCIRELTQPVLGICLGMQILYERSEEGDVDCLGIIPGTVTQLRPRQELPVPHMGWNPVRADGECLLLPSHASGDFFYFVHSYAAPAGQAVQAVAHYGVDVPAIVQWKNWLGVQFHPERSGSAGERLLKRFIDLERA